MVLPTTSFDVQDHLKTPDDRATYLEAALETGDASFITQALNDIARAVGMTEVYRTACITREGLYKSLGKDGDPKLSTLLGVMKAIDMKLTVSPPDHPQSEEA